MVGVKVRNGNLEKALQIFKNRVQRSGILEEYKENQFYTKPSERRRKAAKEARKWEKRKNKLN